MPPRWACIAIVAFWLLMSTLLFQRDLAPRLFSDGLNYAAVLADHAVEESTRWILRSNGRRVGTINGITRPKPDGGLQMLAKVRLTANVLGRADGDSAPQILLESTFDIGSDRRLAGFEIVAGLDRPRLEVSMTGRVNGRKLELVTRGTPLLPTRSEIDIDPQFLIVNALGPLERLPELWVGRRWTTRVVNPIAALLPGQNLLGGSIPMEIVHHSVTGEEITDWGGRNWKCFVIEHVHDKSTAHSWVRQSDGRLLRQEIPLGVVVLTVELDPAVDRWDSRKDIAW